MSNAQKLYVLDQTRVIENKQDNFYINKPFNVFYRVVPNLDERAEYKTCKDLIDVVKRDSTEINTNKEYGNIGIDNSELNIFFFNVGQAESILITNNNAKMLIDCGNNSDGKYISKFLKEQGIGELDYCNYICGK